MTTQATLTNTASAFSRTSSGRSSDSSAVSLVTSTRITADPMLPDETTATETLARNAVNITPQIDEAQPYATASVSVTKNVATFTGNGSATAFTLPFKPTREADLAVTVAGTPTAVTFDSTGKVITFASAPANAAAIVATETLTRASLPDVKDTLVTYTDTPLLTRTNS